MVALVDTNDMIIAERKEKADIDKFDRFGEAMFVYVKGRLNEKNIRFLGFCICSS